MLKNNQSTFKFRDLTFDDIPLMHQWFNTQHIQAFYSLRPWTEDEVLAKLTPYISGEKPVSGFIILLDEHPIGYLQSYKVSDYPWPNQNLPEKIVKSAKGIDLFIGNKDLIGKGVGARIIQLFIKHHIAPLYSYCIVDPDVRNISAIRCYEKLKFKKHQVIDIEDACQCPAQLVLMMLKCKDLT